MSAESVEMHVNFGPISIGNLSHAFSIFIQRVFSAPMSQSSCFRMIGHVGTHEA